MINWTSSKCSTSYLWGATVAALVVTIPAMPALALTSQELDAFASQTTVLIARNLQKGDSEAKNAFDPGSGVIIARNGNTYYALTNLHVVEHQTLYGIRTADGEIHVVDGSNSDNIIRLGNMEGSVGSAYRPISGFDLALIKFESDLDYPVAPVSNSSLMKMGDRIFVSGWPKPEDAEAQRQRITSEGTLSTILSNPWSDGGYSILYDSPTRRGMSGGPVFNMEGQVIGIHGRGRKIANAYCIDPQLSETNSCGLQITHFINQAEFNNLKLAFNYDPANRAVVLRGIVTKSRADFIKDIYKLFTNLDKLKDRVSDLEQRLDAIEKRRNQ